jgi:hypothetical protein
MICLRTVVKMNENQLDMLRRQINYSHGESTTFILKHLLAEIYKSIIDKKSQIFGEGFPVNDPDFEDQIIAFTTFRETEVFIACGWNMNLCTGYECLTSLLQLCNDQYNFR